tara:strand:+ start:10927 stop:11499 length:573 start_codon:yes stop_codon:yes gene_type:complete
MKISKTPFEGLAIIQQNSYNDIRGSFRENFRLKTLEDFFSRKLNFCQDNITYSKKGVIRGMHYQLPPSTQSKLVSVIKGIVLDVVLDLRLNSSTFGKCFNIELSETNKIQLFIPRGFAHGYITLSKESILFYKTDNYYNKEKEACIAFDDSNLEINWQLPKSEWILSKKDKGSISFKNAPKFEQNINLYD